MNNMELRFTHSAQARFDELVKLSQVLNTVFQGTIIAVLLISINVLSNPIHTASLSVVVLFFLLLFFYYLFRKGYLRISGFGMIVSISVVSTYNFLIGGGIHDNALVVFPVLIILAGLVLGKSAIPYMTAIILFEISCIQVVTELGIIKPFAGTITVYFRNFITVFILIVMTGVIIWITISTIETKLQQLLQAEDDLRQSYTLSLTRWGKALALIEKDTEGHNQRVTELTLKIARKHGIKGDDLEHIRRGALLHDIGKMGIAEKVLNKRTSLSAKERVLIEKHPLHAYTLLKDIPYLEKALEIPVYHHECWDGSGYPYHLAGEDIPLAARIFAIVDNWDALISDRPYRKAWPEDKVLLYIENERGKRFDPELVDTFLRFIRNGQQVSQI